MRGINFRMLKSEIGMTQVLELPDYIPARQIGDQLCGPCPIHGTSFPQGQVFSINFRRNVFRCFKYGACGSQLDL